MLAVLQARMGSSRLPGKVMKEVNGQPIIFWQIQRILQTKTISNLILATTTSLEDDSLVNLVSNMGVQVFRGSPNDVLSRFQQVLRQHPEESFVRITGDCPLFMPQVCDEVVTKYQEMDVDYVSNTLKPTYPNGCDVEVVKSRALHALGELELSEAEREHVTLGIYQRSERYKCENYSNPSGLNESHFRWTLDNRIDLDFVKQIYSNFIGREELFDYAEVMGLLIDQKVKAVYEDFYIQETGN